MSLAYTILEVKDLFTGQLHLNQVPYWISKVATQQLFQVKNEFPIKVYKVIRVVNSTCRFDRTQMLQILSILL